MSGQMSAVLNIFASAPAFAALLLGGALSGHSKAGMRLRRRACCSSLARRSWPRWPCLPCGGPERVRQRSCRTRARLASADGSQTTGAALARVPGSADLVSMELRARVGDPASVLPAKHPPRRGRSVGPVERHLRRRLIPTFMLFGVLCQRFPLEDPALLGDGGGGPADGSAALHPFGDRRFDRRGSIGLMGGFASAAYFDLLIRSCPPVCRGRRS